MNIFQRLAVLFAAITSHTGSFTVTLNKVKYLVTVTTTAHTAPLGGFNLTQAGAIAAGFVIGVPFVVRIGADDYTFMATPV